MAAKTSTRYVKLRSLKTSTDRKLVKLSDNADVRISHPPAHDDTVSGSTSDTLPAHNAEAAPSNPPTHAVEAEPTPDQPVAKDPGGANVPVHDAMSETTASDEPALVEASPDAAMDTTAQFVSPNLEAQAWPKQPHPPQEAVEVQVEAVHEAAIFVASPEQPAREEPADRKSVV